MTLRNAIEKRTAVEGEIESLQALNLRLNEAAAELSESIEPLKAKREQLARYGGPTMAQGMERRG